MKNITGGGEVEYTPEQMSADMMPNETLQHIAREIGVDNLIKISKIIGGRTFYFPMEDKLLLSFRNEQIKKEFNGYNALELAKKYNVTERWVREICRATPPNQISFFDGAM